MNLPIYICACVCLCAPACAVRAVHLHLCVYAMAAVHVHLCVCGGSCTCSPVCMQWQLYVYTCVYPGRVDHLRVHLCMCVRVCAVAAARVHLGVCTVCMYTRMYTSVWCAYCVYIYVHSVLTVYVLFVGAMGTEKGCDSILISVSSIPNTYDSFRGWNRQSPASAVFRLQQ